MAPQLARWVAVLPPKGVDKVIDVRIAQMARQLFRGDVAVQQQGMCLRQSVFGDEADNDCPDASSKSSFKERADNPQHRLDPSRVIW